MEGIGPTPFADVNATLTRLEAGVRHVLGEHFVGLYLYGSLASGDFDTATSDIDFLVVTDGALDEKANRELAAMHEGLWRDGGKWAAKLEGAYVAKDSMRRYVSGDGPWPGVNEGAFLIESHQSDWVIQRHVLREWGIVVSGPPIAPMIDPVSADDLRAAVAGILTSWWVPMVEQRPETMEPGGHQVFGVLTMCRALHTVREGVVVSKRVSGRWAVTALDGRWRELIESALAWEGAARLGRRDEVVAFLRWGFGEAGVVVEG